MNQPSNDQNMTEEQAPPSCTTSLNETPEFQLEPVVEQQEVAVSIVVEELPVVAEPVVEAVQN